MDPAFGAPVIKALFPTFVQYAEIVRRPFLAPCRLLMTRYAQLSTKWSKLVESSPGAPCVINVASHLNVATVDAVCESVSSSIQAITA